MAPCDMSAEAVEHGLESDHDRRVTASPDRNMRKATTSVARNTERVTWRKEMRYVQAKHLVRMQMITKRRTTEMRKTKRRTRTKSLHVLYATSPSRNHQTASSCYSCVDMLCTRIA